MGTTSGPSRAATYAIHCRRRVEGAGGDAATPPSMSDEDRPGEQVLLDENALAHTHGYLDVANLAVSPGHSRPHLRHRHHRGRALHPEGARPRDRCRPSHTLEGTSYGVAWANDDATVFTCRA